MSLQADYFVTVGPSGAAATEVRPRIDGASRVSDDGDDADGSHVLIEPIAVGGIARAAAGANDTPAPGIGSAVVGRVVGAGCNVRLCATREGEGLRLGGLVVGVTSGAHDTSLTATVASLPFRHVLPLSGGCVSPDDDAGAVLRRVVGGIRPAMETLAAMRMGKLNLRPLSLTTPTTTTAETTCNNGPSTTAGAPTLPEGGPHRVCLVTSGHCAHVEVAIAVLKHAYSAHVTLLMCPPSASSTSQSGAPVQSQADIVASTSAESNQTGADGGDALAASPPRTLEDAAAASCPFGAVILQRSVASDEGDEDDDTAMAAAVARLLRLDAVPPGASVITPAGFSPREEEHAALRSAAGDAGVILAPAALGPLLRSRWCASDARVVLSIALALLMHGVVDVPVALVSRVKGLARGPNAPATTAGGGGSSHGVGRTDSAAVARAFERAVEDCRRLPAAVAAKGAVVLDLDIASAVAELR